MEDIRLTQFSPGAGCGCKISPMQLDVILKSALPVIHDPRLLVGNESRDDAAVYDLGNGTAVISTTDFFMPITDDAFDFGRIASANAISDVFAMGGKPLMAIAILGWPLEKLPAELAAQVLEGSRSICREAGIPLAGGHSIDSLEPIFGLAVTGLADLNKIKRNDTATPGCTLYLTKPLGVGIFSTAQKNGILAPEHALMARDSMIMLNSIGLKLADFESVKAMTDVTGFGLLGHLAEMCEGSNVNAEIEFENIPIFPGIETYLEQKAIPGGSKRNWKSYGHKVSLSSDFQRNILCDPQTSGGLLVAVEAGKETEIESLFTAEGQFYRRIGRICTFVEGEVRIEVIDPA